MIRGVLCNILIIFSWEFEKLYPNKVTKDNKNKYPLKKGSVEPLLSRLALDEK